MTSSPGNPTAAIIIIGAEVLSAKLKDTNGPYLLENLRAHGIEVIELRIIRDDISTIADTIMRLHPQVDYLFTTGGIGPTHDDVTIQGVTQALGRPTIEHPLLLQQLEEHFGQPLKSSVRTMSRVPDGTKVEMIRSTLPLLECDNIFILPGIPSLVRVCFEHLSQSLEPGLFVERKILARVAESEIAEHLDKVQQEFSSSVQIGSYPKKDSSGWYVEITLDGQDVHQVEQALRQIREGLCEDWAFELE